MLSWEDPLKAGQIFTARFSIKHDSGATSGKISSLKAKRGRQVRPVLLRTSHKVDSAKLTSSSPAEVVCKGCSGFRTEFFESSGNYHKHQTKYAHILESSLNGCESCRVVNEAVVTLSEKSLESETEIALHAPIIDSLKLALQIRWKTGLYKPKEYTTIELYSLPGALPNHVCSYLCR